MSEKSKIIDHDIYLSGPVNIVRLEGKVDNIKKVIYLFFDYHIFSTECKSVDSIDVHKYFIKFFESLSKDKSEKIFDFFVETFSHDIEKEQNSDKFRAKNNYLQNVRKIFSNLIKITTKNKIHSPDKYKNVRLHFTDIRDLIYKNNAMDPSNHTVDAIYDHSYNMKCSNFSVENYKKTLINLENTQKNSFDIINSFENSNSKFKLDKSIVGVVEDRTKKFKGSDYDKIINNLFYKMRHEYKNNEISAIMNNVLSCYFLSGMYSLIQKIKKATEIMNNNKKMFEHTKNFSHKKLDDTFLSEYLDNLSNKLSDIGQKDLTTYSILIDCYMIRRMLDKKYITNCLYYAGAAHTSNIIYILIKYFNFKMTHCSYNKYDVNEFNDKIKHMTIDDILENLVPDEFYQCSNLKNFPVNFE